MCEFSEKNLLTLTNIFKEKGLSNEILKFVGKVHLLPHIGTAMNTFEFSDSFTYAYQNNLTMRYEGSWEEDIQDLYFHDLRLSYALYFNKDIMIRLRIGEKKFQCLTNIKDKNGLKLKDSNYTDIRFSD